MTRETGRRSADIDNDVVTVEGGVGNIKRPCHECPWRRENAGSFPAEAFRISARTAYDMSSHLFGCHMAGVDRASSCAGGLLSTGAAHSMTLRMRAMSGDLPRVESGGADLFPSYRDMAEANGVDPEDPALRGCR